MHMSNALEANTVYGVPIRERVRAKALRTLKRFKRKYGGSVPGAFPLRARDNQFLAPLIGLKEVYSGVDGDPVDYDKAVFIGTIRMGYGHYRIGMALASAAFAKGYQPYWFDLLGFDSSGARMIKDLDKWYSLGSRLSQKSKIFNKCLWDPLMGKWYKRLEKNYPIMTASAIFADTHGELPPDAPFLATHPFNAQGALHAGLRRVVNVVPDNCPLGFHLAPGALHVVQTPSAYYTFRTLRGLGEEGAVDQGIPADQVFLAGHYVDHELAANIDADCDARLARLRGGVARRLLISIGGAGAQQGLLADLIERMTPDIRAGRATLLINCGDHQNALDYFNQRVPGFAENARIHVEWEEMQSFISGAACGEAAGLHVFLHENPFVAVYATNLLMRVADILLTKPSELAFYPIPKLMLERVGGHEVWGAIRAAELGDGTAECMGISLTRQTLDLMLRETDLLEMYCAHIKKLGAMGVYNGAYRAVDLAVLGRFD